MLKSITKLRRTFDNGFGIFYYEGTTERADHPLSSEDLLDKLDEVLDRLNLLSALENKRKEK